MGEGRRKVEFGPRIVFLLAITCGALVANLYYVQPIAGLIAAQFGLDRHQTGLLSTLPLAGYCFGLFFIVPLADLVENRRLILVMMAMESASLVLLFLAKSSDFFFAVSFLVGLAATAIQVILPYTSQFITGPRQGRAVASLVSGIMLGIMVARPLASSIAQYFPWNRVYLLAFFIISCLTSILILVLPARTPQASSSYTQLLSSMILIFRETEVLRRRAFYQACVFGAFISFWTAVPLWLTGAPFHLSQRGIAYVALAGVAGALAPPLATRVFDAGYLLLGTRVVMCCSMAAFLITLLGQDGSTVPVVVAAVLLDAAVSANLVLGQRAIYSLGTALRGRLNALYISIFFSGGAAASAAAGWCFGHYGWPAVIGLGVALPALALFYSTSEGSRIPTSDLAS